MAVPGKKTGFALNQERTALLICIGISLIIWIFLKLSKDYETTWAIHLKYELPPMMEFTDTPPATTMATVHGNGIDLAKKFLTKTHPTVLIDLSEYPKREVPRNELVFKIQEELNLNVRDITLNYLFFSIDSTATKKVPVVLDMTVDFQKDFFLKEPIHLSADSVILSGPQQELERVNHVKTEAVNFPSVNANETRAVRISTNNFKNIQAHPAEVTINIMVEQFTEKTLAVPVKVVNAQDSVQVLPSTVNVKCSVGLSKYDELTATAFSVEVDLRQAAKFGGQKSLPVYLKSSPAWVRSPQVSPKVVEYLIVK